MEVNVIYLDTFSRKFESRHYDDCPDDMDEICEIFGTEMVNDDYSIAVVIVPDFEIEVLYNQTERN